MSGFTVIIPAKNEQEWIGRTLSGILANPRVHAVVVVDDASTDRTAVLAREAGASVLSRDKSAGKAAALMAGADYARREGLIGADGILLLDADVGSSVIGIAPVLDSVADGETDLAIAKYVARGSGGGGRGRVVRLARQAILKRTGWEATVPLSGIRAMTWPAWSAVQPLARGWGVETAMTIDALRAGQRVLEVDTTMTHRATGSDWRAKRHRGRQYLDVHLALLARRRR